MFDEGPTSSCMFASIDVLAYKLTIKKSSADEVQPSPGSAIDVNLQLPPRQVFTKHSFLSEIRQMANSHDADETISSNEAAQGSQIPASLTRLAQMSRPQEATGPDNNNSVPINFTTEAEDRQEFSGLSADYDMTWMLGPDFAMGNAEYDILMDPFLRMQNGVENGPWGSERFPGSDQNDTFYF